MEKFDLENFPTSESAKRMLSYVSDNFYDDSYVGKWLFQVMGTEYDSAREIIESLPDQFFPEKATWGLMFHEIKWGLPVRENLSYEERRRLIYQKRDFKAPMTPYRMEIYLANATGFEAHVADVHDAGEYGYNPEHPNVFKVTFIGDGTLSTKKALDMLNQIRQSHTTYIINDRVSIVFDNSNLEKILLRNINLKISIPFWYCTVFDGTWNFDGSILMNAQRRYDLRFGIMYNEGSVETTESAYARLITARTAVVCDERIENAGEVLLFGINFWNILRFDGTWKFDGSKKLDSLRQDYNPTVSLLMPVEGRKEEVGAVTLTTTRNLWFFDGSIKMDGSRLLNSINRKEEI